METCGPYKIISETGSGEGWTSFLARDDRGDVLLTLFTNADAGREVIELQQRAASPHVAEVVNQGTCDEGEWYATRHYPRSLGKLLEGRVELSRAWILAVLLGVARGALAYKRACGRAHGGLHLYNILLSGTTNLREAEIAVKDAAPGQGEELEKRDLKAIGMALYQLVRRREIDERSMILPLEISPEWKSRFGKDAERWVSLCNRLLDPGVSLEKYSLTELERDLLALEPKAPVSRKQLLAAAAIVVLAAIAGTIVAMVKDQATLEVSANLPGATVTVSSEGKVLQTIALRDAPAKVKARKGQTYTLSAKRDDFSASLDVLAAARTQPAQLVFQYGALNITAVEEGTTKRLWSTNMVVPPGVQVKQAVVVDNYQPGKVERALQAGETNEVIVSLKRTLPGQVKIRVDARPITAFVEIRNARDEIVAGPEAGEVNDDLSPGTYKIVLRYIVGGREVTALTNDIAVDAHSPRVREITIPTQRLQVVAQDAANDAPVEGATIWHGGAQVGSTSDLARLWPVGTWDFEVRANGYETVNLKGVSLRNEAPTRHPVKLTRILAELTVTSDPASGVRFGTEPNRLSSEAPGTILLPPGTHIIYGRHPDLGWATNRLDLVRGKTNTQLAFSYGVVKLSANLSNVTVSITPLNRRVELRPDSTLLLPPGGYSFEATYAAAQPPLLTNKAATLEPRHKQTPLQVHFDFAFAKVVFASIPELGADVYDERRIFLGTAQGTNELIVPQGKRTYYFVGGKNKKTNAVERELASLGPHRIESDFTKPQNFVTPFKMEFIWVDSLACYVGVTEVTQFEYETVVKSNPSVGARTPLHPVNSVTHNQAVEFCRQLQTAAPPPTGFAYGLPTEQQWRSFVGDALTNEALAVIRTTNALPVRSRPPNQHGLHDVRGNVFEWLAEGRPVGGRYNSPGLPTGGIFFFLTVPPHGNHPDSTTGFRVILAPRNPASVAAAPQSP